MEVLPSAGLSIRARHEEDEALRTLHQQFRELATPIIGRLSNGALLLDLRCLTPDQESHFIEQLNDIAP